MARIALDLVSDPRLGRYVHNFQGIGTGQNEWYTPDPELSLVREVLGIIDLDPASSAVAQQRVRATKYYTLEQDGLKHTWRGRVYMNPPYARQLIPRFVAKLLDELKAGHVTDAIMLTHNYTDRTWFQSAAKYADAICFPDHRIHFLDPEGNPAQPFEGQAFFYYGNNPEIFEKFVAKFGTLGWTVVQVVFRVIELPVSVDEQLQRYCSAHGLTEQDVMRQAFEKCLADETCGASIP
jgi:DNA N-6-adenine-methyltransferase (Dam)